MKESNSGGLDRFGGRRHATSPDLRDTLLLPDDNKDGRDDPGEELGREREVQRKPRVTEARRD
eukprot:CAMPEP_0195642672 /NCGR_PEP_ID=MMETSP0815-20121206/27411_1 /TAXON_ID=97485 /ORGANISM="Prymnesium parvum, Strain Texoma1" /LENGTH=62 /DNA_ID=CAMNT_0040785631 /DNA_START=469 /DNA_END=654 /DNA_ORIENTATION=+